MTSRGTERTYIYSLKQGTCTCTSIHPVIEDRKRINPCIRRLVSGQLNWTRHKLSDWKTTVAWSKLLKSSQRQQKGIQYMMIFEAENHCSFRSQDYIARDILGCERPADHTVDMASPNTGHHECLTRDQFVLRQSVSNQWHVLRDLN